MRHAGVPGALARRHRLCGGCPRNVVTVKAERPPRAGDAEAIAAERPRGVFSRQLILGDNLDTEHIAASYDSGMLILQIPVAEKAKPRKISIASQGEDRPAINA